MEAYIDDMIVKSKREADHPDHLVDVFDMLKEHQLKLNVEKCELGQIPWTFGDVPRHRD